jgi:Fe/S biogenesis protein NfuA
MAVLLAKTVIAAGDVTGAIFDSARDGLIMGPMTTDTANETLLTITDAAQAKVLEVRANEPDPETLALWLEVSGTQGDAYTYDMYFQELDKAAADDVVLPVGDLQLVIVSDSVDKVRGATLDFAGTGMVMQNPNRPAPVAPLTLPKGDVTSEIAQLVIKVLDVHVNPAIASHGGRAELMAVDKGIAYITMSGGCQGCAMSAQTLRQGIEVAILDNVPDITEVVDVTDHAVGAAPYYS